MTRYGFGIVKRTVISLLVHVSYAGDSLKQVHIYDMYIVITFPGNAHYTLYIPHNNSASTVNHSQW